MKAARLKGRFTIVDIWVGLENGTRWYYRWSTPIAPAPALHKAPHWAKAELKKEKIRGRSSILEYDVHVKSVTGRFQ